jgi:glucose-1-phosphate adenylyltransferase
MNGVIGVVNLGSATVSLGALTRSRSIASVPFGGRYRLIDFPLSNMSNSGLQKVAIFSPQQCRSLVDHLGAGKEWDLDRRHGGLFVLPPVHEPASMEYKGDLQNLYGHLDYFDRSKEEIVVVAHSHLIYNVDYQKCIDFHIREKADITMLYSEMPKGSRKKGNQTYLQIADRRVIGMQRATAQEDVGLDSSHISNLFLESFIINKQRLVQLMKDSISKGKYDLTDDILFAHVNKLKTLAYRHTGHVAVIDSISDYFDASMQLLQPDLYQSLFFHPGLIYTKIKDEPPTKYFESSNVHRALIANGCEIEGTVENSILFRGVKVGKGAQIKNCIIMQKCVIEPGAYIEQAILDKEVVVSEGQILLGNASEPVVLPKRMVL